MSVENWLPIPGFPGYEVSDMGRVRSFKKRSLAPEESAPYILKTPLNKKGYPNISLYINGTTFNKRVHQLVMLAFVGPRPEGLEVCHNDETRQNNQLSNLRYDTHESNVREAAASGRMGRPSDRSKPKRNRLSRSDKKISLFKKLLPDFAPGLPPAPVAEAPEVEVTTR